LWYGNTQEFGSSGKAQRYVNVVGNLNRAMEWKSMAYSLNGSSLSPLSIGPDTRRLQRKGDFNVEIPFTDLEVGENIVLLTAETKGGESFEEIVTLQYVEAKPDAEQIIDWREVNALSDVAQVIDGFWEVKDDALTSHPDFVGYDRVIGFGDMTWTDYEVVFPFTVSRLDESSYESDTSLGPALLFTLRWQGHTDAPAACGQPHCGWEPFGGLVSFSFNKENDAGGVIFTRWMDKLVASKSLQIVPGNQYWVRLRSETSGMGNVYSLKLWSGSSGNEPKAWSLSTIANPLNLTKGAFLVVAHHIDLKVGNMIFTQVGNLRNNFVQFLTESADYLVQLPYLFIWLLGMFWGRFYMKRDPSRGVWVVVAFGIIFLTSLAGFLLNTYLPVKLQDSGWITRRLTYVYVAINLIPITGHLIGWPLLMWKLTPSKKV
jgi:hypothetical protein